VGTIYRLFVGRYKTTMVQEVELLVKAFIGSTLNPMAKGGSDFKKMDIGSNVLKQETAMVKLLQDYMLIFFLHIITWSYLINMEFVHVVVEKERSFVNAQR
jgi:hypothetical protein